MTPTIKEKFAEDALHFYQSCNYNGGATDAKHKRKQRKRVDDRQYLLYHPFNFVVDARAVEFEKYWKQHMPGLAPPGHPMRCQALETTNMVQCDRYRKRSSRFCAACTRFAMKKQVNNFYGHHIPAGKLQGLLEQAAEMPEAERLTLVNEINVARAGAIEATKLLAAAMEVPGEKRSIAISIAMGAVNETLNGVASLVEKHSRILSRADDLYSAGQVSWMVKSIKRVIEGAGLDAKQTKNMLELINELQFPDKTVAEVAKVVID